MRPYLLIDFGSTYTKLTAVDLDEPRVLGTSAAITTIRDGLIHGYRCALERLNAETGPIRFQRQLACSSAAGGLKIVAIGLVPELTVEAAKRAALGAGGRVIGVFSHQLSGEDLVNLEAMRPDLILLAGGTDGGERQTILHNGRMLAESKVAVPIVVAGNRAAAPEVEAALIEAGKTIYRVANVLPELGRLNVEPVQQTIREIFLKHIVQAKGLDQVERFIDGIAMPTPAAALESARLLADGDGTHPGLGELMVIDIGGATTDVHTVASGLPARAQVSLRGLPEPRIKRTVEGDLGMRYSAPALLEFFSAQRVASLTGLNEAQVREGISRRESNPEYLPENEPDRHLEQGLGYLAVKGAVERHAGRTEPYYTPMGQTYIQTGKDLTGLRTVIGTGGILAHSSQAKTIMRGALFDPAYPEILTPVQPKLLVDRGYLLPTLGLIAREFPTEAFALLAPKLEEA